MYPLSTTSSKQTTFDDDNFIILGNTSIEELIEDIKKDLDIMAKDSDIKVNETKTELCVLNRMDTCPVSLTSIKQ
jgi:hypothetical protein